MTRAFAFDGAMRQERVVNRASGYTEASRHLDCPEIFLLGQAHDGEAFAGIIQKQQRLFASDASPARSASEKSPLSCGRHSCSHSS